MVHAAQLLSNRSDSGRTTTAAIGTKVLVGNARADGALCTNRLFALRSACFLLSLVRTRARAVIARRPACEPRHTTHTYPTRIQIRTESVNTNDWRYARRGTRPTVAPYALTHDDSAYKRQVFHDGYDDCTLRFDSIDSTTSKWCMLLNALLLSLLRTCMCTRTLDPCAGATWPHILAHCSNDHRRNARYNCAALDCAARATASAGAPRASTCDRTSHGPWRVLALDQRRQRAAQRDTFWTVRLRRSSGSAS